MATRAEDFDGRPASTVRARRQATKADAIDQELLTIWVALYRKTRSYFRSNMERFGLTAAQASVLHELYDGSFSQRELAARLEMDASAVSVVVGQLADRGLVAKVVDESDRRVRRVSLTKKGLALQQRMMESLVFEAFVIEDLDTTAKRRLIEALAPLTRDQRFFECAILERWIDTVERPQADHRIA